MRREDSAASPAKAPKPNGDPMGPMQTVEWIAEATLGVKRGDSALDRAGLDSAEIREGGPALCRP
jgi:hypothetical protein